MHIFNVIGWTADQWIMFACFTAAGLAGLGLVALWVRDHRAPAPLRVSAPWNDADIADFVQRWPGAVPLDPRSIDPAHLAAVAVPLTDENWREHIAPGPGSLATLREVGEGSLTTAEPLVAPDVASDFAFAFDRPAYSPGPTEAGVIDPGGIMAQFDAALEGAMRKVRLWELQGEAAKHGTSAGAWAHRQLDRWRMDTPTGEYAMVEV